MWANNPGHVEAASWPHIQCLNVAKAISNIPWWNSGQKNLSRPIGVETHSVIRWNSRVSNGRSVMLNFCQQTKRTEVSSDQNHVVSLVIQHQSLHWTQYRLNWHSTWSSVSLEHDKWWTGQIRGWDLNSGPGTLYRSRCWFFFYWRVIDFMSTTDTEAPPMFRENLSS